MSHSLPPLSFAPAFLLAFTACGTVIDTTDEPDIEPDAPPATARCDSSKRFDTPTLVANVNTADGEMAFSLTGDELTAFVTTDVSLSLAAAQRDTTTTPFGTPSRGMLASINNEEGYEYEPAPTSDGLFLYFVRYTLDGALQLFESVRDSSDAAFSSGVEVRIDGFSVTGIQEVAISRDDVTLYWVDNSESKLHAATMFDLRAFTDSRDVSTIPVSEIVLSADELTLYYTQSGLDILMATRASTADAFDTGVPVPNVNSPDLDAPVYITADDCVLYLKSTRPGGFGGYDIWEARRPR